MGNDDVDKIELRSEKVRHVIGEIPPSLVRTGTVIITLVVIVLAFAFCTIHFPITIEAQGLVTSKDTISMQIPYKYLYLFNEKRQVGVTYEGQDDDDITPSVYTISSHDDKLVTIGGMNYFTATACISSDSSRVLVGQKVQTRIIVSDETIRQLVFK